MGHKDGRAHIVCRKLADGSEIWSTPIGGGDPNCTPTVDPDAGLVFGLTHSGELSCVEADSGTAVWDKNYGRDFGGKMMSGWGYSESPLVDGDRLICTPGALDAMIVALDRKSGRTVWKARQPADVGRGGAEGSAYSSIVISNAAGVKQYVQLTGRGLISVAADDGRTLWTYNRVANNVANIPTPIVRGDYVFCSSGYGVGSGLVKVTRQGGEIRAEEVYFLGGDTLQNHHGGMVLLGDHVYMGHGHGNGFPVCVEFATGDIVWGGRIRGAGSGSAAVVYADGHLYFRYEDGVMALIEASPESYRLKGSFRVASNNGKSWPHPVIHGGRLYLRDQDELLCYDVRAQADAALPAEAEEAAVALPISDDTSTPSDPESTATTAQIASQSTNWPRFRGPTGQGVSTEVGLPLEWSATKNIVWKIPLPGPGASSPIVWGDHVYVTCYSGYGVDAEAPGNPADLKRHLVCLNRGTGRILWNEAVLSPVTEQPFSDSLARHGYASSTPIADQDGIYVFFGASGVAAYTHGGKQKWHRSCGTSTQRYGSATSPILVGDLLIVDASIESPDFPGGSALFALDKRTGETVWKQTGIGGGGYLTPTFVESNGKRQLVVSQPWGHDLVGASLESGDVLWRCNVSAYTPTPVVDEKGVLYVFSKYAYAAIRTGGSGNVTESHKLWEVKSSIYRQASPIYWQGYLYWTPMDGGVVRCANAETGELIYEERINPHKGQMYASPVLADGRIYFISRENGAYVVPAQPEFQLLAHNVIETDESIFNGSPAISGGRIFLRSDRFLYCIGTVSP